MELKKILLVLVIAFMTFSMNFPTEAIASPSGTYWYKGAANNKDYSTDGSNFNPSSHETSTMTLNAWMSSTTAEARVNVRGFARYESIQRITGQSQVKVDYIKAGLADADPRSAMWIDGRSPSESSSNCIPEAIYDLAAFTYLADVVKVITNGVCSSTEYFSAGEPSGYDNKGIKFYDTFGLPLSVGADNSYDAWHVETYANERAESGYTTGVNAWFKFSIGERDNYNYTFRPYVGIGYTVKQDFMFSYPVYSGYAQGYYRINTN
ncbi:hypothetical protein [Chengkuizengella sediminis]|uniref:hypothetical protein n=1 Tax=Chengkuizengella sediminis TaxID=1885917 RepID=UPI001389A40F|nr:hypothetical protein [Chengkuizengella sediminis]NDI36351.1 hypothetical protein [Chengkuizengella sediminis]